MTPTIRIPAGFARLLATENIGVRVSASAKTASFDVVKRMLTMPNWQCSDRLRDMLIGHEVGHAVFTTIREGEDFDATLARIGSNLNVAKTYFNVTEDARIDRLIQRRYPGLRHDYAAGYREMRDRDFFGVAGRDPNSLNLIDRLNLYAKGYPNIEFADDEQIFAARLDGIETLDDAVDLARDIYNFANEKQNKQEQSKQEQSKDSTAGSDSDDEQQDDQQDDQQESAGDSGEIESSEEAGDSPSSDDSGESQQTEQQPAKGDEQQDQQNQQDQQQSSEAGPEAAETGSYMQNSIESLADASDHGWKQISNVMLPTFDMINTKSLIVSHKTILEDAERCGDGWRRTALLHHGKNKYRDNYTAMRAAANSLGQMFDRKKAAAISTRTRIAKTGRIDTNALAKYRFTDDIFLRNRIETKGKNHGIVIYLDWSGSMSPNISETISQTVLLAMFCKRAGIPYRIYAFSSTGWASTTEHGNTSWLDRDAWYEACDNRGYDGHRGGLADLALLEFFSSEMKSRDFDRMAELLMNYEYTYNWSKYLNLGGTPLQESIIAGMKVSTEFRKQYQIDVLNSIWITDGSAGCMLRSNGTATNPNNSRVYTVDGLGENMATLRKMYKDQVGGNLLGFFLTNIHHAKHRICGHRWDRRPADEKRYQDFRRNHYIASPQDGYDYHYLMNSNVATFGEETQDALEALPENATGRRACTAFRKSLGKRSMNRPLLNSITDHIAKELV